MVQLSRPELFVSSVFFPLPKLKETPRTDDVIFILVREVLAQGAET